MVSQETDSYHSWPDSLCTEDQYNLTGVSSLAFVVHSWPCWQLVFIKLSDMASLAAPSLLPALRCTIYLTLTLYCFFVCNEQVRCVDHLTMTSRDNDHWEVVDKYHLKF